MRLIDADELLAPIAECEEREGCKGCPCEILDCEDFERIIKAAPTMKPEQKGKWRKEIDTGMEMMVCSECGRRAIRKWYSLAVGSLGYKFCPYCGAEMEVKSDELDPRDH